MCVRVNNSATVSTYLSVDQRNTDHVIMKQHATLPSECIQFLLTHK